MKKIIALLSLTLVLITMACSNKPAVVKKEVIVVPVTTQDPPPAKSTTVTLDKNGVKVETKKVNVSVKNN